MSTKPHISPALLALRGWVTAASFVLVVCALVQAITFALARYTDARVSELVPPPNTTIVAHKDRPASAPVAAAPAERRGEATDPNRVRSITDYNLALTSSAVTAAGLTAVIALTLMTGLGTLIAAGGAVPGVAYAVRAFVWSAVTLGLCLPWSGFAGKSMVPGVFCNYQTLTAAAGSTASTTTISHVVMPIAVLVLSGCITFWFRRGTAAGVIFTNLSEVDEALEREMATIRERGVGRLNPGARAGAAVLHQTLRAERLAIPEPGPLRKAAGAESMSDDDDELAAARSFLHKKSGAPQRPI